MNKATEKVDKRDAPVARSETRDAVENAMDKSKSNKHSTWETVVHGSHKRIGRWKEGGLVSHKTKP